MCPRPRKVPLRLEKRNGIVSFVTKGRPIPRVKPGPVHDTYMTFDLPYGTDAEYLEWPNNGNLKPQSAYVDGGNLAFGSSGSQVPRGSQNTSAPCGEFVARCLLSMSPTVQNSLFLCNTHGSPVGVRNNAFVMDSEICRRHSRPF